VYSTKEFPGLRASTDLTKVRHLPFFHLGTLPNACVSLLIMRMCGDKKTALVVLWRPPQFARDGAQETKKS
jgi:hypothetical protein